MPWTPDTSEKLTAFAVALLAALAIFLASPANAQPISYDGADPGDVDPVYLKTGELAPFNGDLWPPVRSMRLVLRAEYCAEKAATDLRNAARKFTIELDAKDQMAQATRDADAERIRILTEALENARPWYESPYFVIPTTVAATVGLVALSVWVVSEASPPFAQFSAP